MFTTAGVTRSSMSAREGRGWPSISAGRAAWAARGRASPAAPSRAARARSVATWAGAAGRASQCQVAAPPTAAASRKKKAISGRIGFLGPETGGCKGWNDYQIGPGPAADKGRRAWSGPDRPAPERKRHRFQDILGVYSRRLMRLDFFPRHGCRAAVDSTLAEG